MEIYKIFKTTIGLLMTVGIAVSDAPCNPMDGNGNAITIVQAAETDPNDLIVISSLTSEQQREITFNACFYANMYPDLKAVYGYDAAALYQHFLNWGIQEGRCASPVFDVAYYLEVQTDLKAAFGNDYVAAYRHWLQNGYLEERESSKYYNGVYYRQNNSDLVWMNSYELMHHFLNFAAQEGRIANTSGILLDGSLMKAYYPAYAGVSGSIIVALNDLGVDSGDSNRAKIAMVNGIENYTGTAEQNIYLLNLLRLGKLINPDVVNGIQESAETIKLSVPLYKQADKAWGKVYIGSKTIGKVGCLITSLAMKHSYQTGEKIYPDTMRYALRFKGNGLIWDSMKKALGYEYTKEYNVEITDDIMATVYGKLQEGIPVIIGGKGAKSTHWVVITGYTGTNMENFSTGDFIINDPGNNRTTLKDFLKVYPKVLRLIY